MREVQKEFREVHCFRVYWRSGFYGQANKARQEQTKNSRNRLKILIRRFRACWCLEPTPHCVFSLSPSTASVEENTFQRAVPCSVQISPPLTGMDMELTGVTAPAGRSLRQLRSCSTAESCAVRRGTQLLSPDPQRWKNRMLTKREGNKLLHFVVLNFSEFILQID